ncbi:MAG TPA: lipopolysaccharide core heptose(I) kinase RfaP [Gammaproteobacteria bacterium]|jgi:UDP-glucose:(heptosyl)LPS alpha-1,3-glucosyltransferase|nr:lipopolysaccharide core heptose(I) kinase RfaP [Gammaproteobacteria bacterium]
MKLAFCLFNYFPYGGLQRDFLRITEQCALRGHDIHVFTLSWQGAIPTWVNLHLVKSRGWQNHQMAASFAKKIATIKKDYDFVIGFNKMPHLDWYYAADTCYQARKRSFLYHLLPRYRQKVAFEKAVFDASSKTQILLIAPMQQHAFASYYHTQTERFHLLPPGIAKDRLAGEDAHERRQHKRQSLSLPDDTIMLLMVGSGFKTKGVDRAIHALSALPPHLKARSQLLIVGQDNTAPFTKLAHTLSVENHVHFLGGRDDVPDLLLAADLLLHPAYHENTGTVLLEAIAAGLPVLTTAVCGYAPYIQQAKAGVVTALPFSQTTYNEALATILTMPRDDWKRNGVYFAKTHDLYSMPEKAADLILKPVTKITVSTFENMMRLTGKVFREQKGRVTQQISINDKQYFIKQHHGIGYREMLKNIFQLRLPVTSAKNEWLALHQLQSLDIAVPAPLAYEERGWDPAKRKSYILMEDISSAISLEQLCQTWVAEPPSFYFKKMLIQKVAMIARQLHQHGINHRDFYICHFLLDQKEGHTLTENTKLYLIDLHRAQLRHKTPRRWIIKDLAGLAFSSQAIGLTKKDYFRFIKYYTQKPLRFSLKENAAFWREIKTRSEGIE